MAPLFEFDPTSEDAANSPLEIWSTTDYAVTAFSAPAPPLEAQWAGTVDTEGSLIASRKHQNRTISITVDVATAAGLRNLQAKVAKIARESGTAKQTFPNSEVVIWDLHASDTFEPQFDITYYTNTGTFCTVNLTLLAKPYGRGPAVTLSTHTASNTKAPLIFTETGLKGDMLALGTLKLANATNTKTFTVWGLQSRNYDSASTAGLLAEGEDGVAGPAATAAAVGYTGASGGGTNKVMRYTNVGTTGATYYSIGLGTGTTLTHVGTYRVFARVQADSANTGIVQLQLGWAPNKLSRYTFNDWVPVQTSAGAAIKGSWVIVDLGMVSIARAQSGTHQWRTDLFAKSSVSTDDLDVDWVAFVPVDEGFGEVTATDALISSTGAVTVSHQGALVSDSTQTYWATPAVYEGAYLRVPPAGLESRTVRIIAFLAGANGGNLTDTLVDAANLDAISATLTYTPRYLVVPSP